MGKFRTFATSASLLALLTGCTLNLWEKPGSAELVEGYKLRDAGKLEAAYLAYKAAEKEAFHDGVKAKALVAQARALQQGKGIIEDDAAAFTLYSRAAKLGYVGAELAQANMIASGEGVPANTDAAREIYLKHQDRASAVLALAELSDSEAEQQQWNDSARELLLEQSEEGDAKAMVQLARLYEKDETQDNHLKRADFWYGKAVESGHIRAVSEMAEFRSEHFDVAPEQQLALVNQAIERDDAPSLRWVGDQYYAGETFEKDDAKAKEFYIAAAELGDLPAEQRLAKLAENERILAEREATRLARIEKRQKEREALVAKRRAKARGVSKRARGETVISNTRSMLNEAQKLVAGVDGKPNIEKAYAIYREASERGSAEAQYYLGVGYARGFGVEQDSDAAKHWLNKALSGGYVLAESVLEMLLAQ